jgi:Predicted esterase of the alpha-beta hydrolase superfamily
MRKQSSLLRSYFAIAASLFLFVSLTSAQQRPKIGLTLSGGGAKGLAHIGILKAIDSAGLKVDYITGTSMGAVVGALYAAGYSGKEIEKIANDIDWNAIFNNNPQYSDIALREKDEFGGYLLEVPIKYFRPALTSGFMDPEGVWTEFLKILYPVYRVKNFHKLSIPFECVATDLETGKPVMLSTGELAQAIRSSMAIPTVFTPIAYQDKILVDGGLVQNFPVSQVKKMGADYVIGVSLYSGLLNRNQIKSALNVMDQITSYVDADDEVKQKSMCDILIMPPMGDYNAASFGDSKEIIRIGNEMGAKMYPKFKQLADSLNAIQHIDYNPYTRFKSEPPVTLDTIEVVGISETTRKQLLDNMALKVGRTYSARRLSDALKRAYATLDYKYIYYELIPSGIPNHAKMRIIAEEYSSTWVKVGLLYNSFLGTAINLNYTVRNFRNTYSRSMVKLAIGDNFDGLIQSRLLFGQNNKNQLQAELRITDLNIPLYKGAKRLYVYSTTFNKLDLSYTRYLGNTSSIGVGISFNYTAYSPDIAADVRYSGNESLLYGYVVQYTNSLDRRFFPTHGMTSKVEVGCGFARNLNRNPSQSMTNYDTILLKLNAKPFYKIVYNTTVYSPVSPSSSIIWEAQLGAMLDFSGLYYSEFFLGGEQSLFRHHMNFTGLKDAQLITTSFGSVLLGWQTNVYNNLYLQGKVNYGIYDFIKNQTLYAPQKGKQLWGFGLSVGYFISKWPINLSVSYSPEMNKVCSSFSLGYAF